MRKKWFLFILVFVLSVSLSACASQPIVSPEAEVPQLKVVASIFPLYDLVQTVGGEKIETLLALEPGASPHTYEATPSKVREMSGAKAFFTIGAGLDGWAENIAKPLAGAKIIAMDQYVTLKPFQQEKQTHEDEEIGQAEGEVLADDHGEFDPHYWLDPAVVEAMLPRIAEELGELDPANKDYFQATAANYVAELQARAAQWQEKLGSLTDREIVVFHDAWGYFADYFGLAIVASFEPFPGKTPSPAYLVGLQQAVREHDIKTLFVEPQLSADALETLASDLGVQVEVLDPLGGVPGRDNYVDLIDYNVNKVYEALKS